MGPWTEKQKEAFYRLSFRRFNKEKIDCYYCTSEALYDQPEKDSGEIVSVCKKHFNLNSAS